MAYNPQNPNGQTTAANSSPVVLASDQTAIPITDNAGSITVDGSVSVSNFPATQAVSGTVTANAGTGTMNVSVQNASIPVTGTFFQATQPVSGTITANAGTGTMAVDVQNASIPVTGTFWQTTQPVSGTVTANAGTGTMNVSVQNASIPVTGTFFQATQPVSGTVAATQSGTWNVGLSTGANAIGSITNTSFASTQSGAWNVGLNAGTNAIGSITNTSFASTQSGTWNVGLSAGTNAIGSITNTSFAATQATAANLNATVVGTGTFAVQADTELPPAAALADATANPTTPTIGGANLGFNGTTWDRLRTDGALAGTAANNTIPGILAVGIGPGFAIRLNPTNLATAASSTSVIDVDGATTISIGIGTTTTGTFIFEGTADAANWFAVEVFDASADLWVSGQNLTPTIGKTYHIATGGLRQLRLRTVTTLGATVAHVVNLSLSQQLIAGIDTGAAPHNFGYTLVHKDGEYTTAQTGTIIWTPTTNKKFAITDLTISVGGTTSGIVTIFDAIAATTTYTAGTTPAIWRGEFAPSANTKPGALKTFNVPYVSTTANNVVHITTSAAMTVYIQINGYEI